VHHDPPIPGNSGRISGDGLFGVVGIRYNGVFGPIRKNFEGGQIWCGILAIKTRMAPENRHWISPAHRRAAIHGPKERGTNRSKTSSRSNRGLDYQDRGRSYTARQQPGVLLPDKRNRTAEKLQPEQSLMPEEANK